jgi:hypothetical protein
MKEYAFSQEEIENIDSACEFYGEGVRKQCEEFAKKWDSELLINFGLFWDDEVIELADIHLDLPSLILFELESQVRLWENEEKSLVKEYYQETNLLEMYANVLAELQKELSKR